MDGGSSSPNKVTSIPLVPSNHSKFICFPNKIPGPHPIHEGLEKRKVEKNWWVGQQCAVLLYITVAHFVVVLTIWTFMSLKGGKDNLLRPPMVSGGTGHLAAFQKHKHCCITMDSSWNWRHENMIYPQRFSGNMHSFWKSLVFYTCILFWIKVIFLNSFVRVVKYESYFQRTDTWSSWKWWSRACFSWIVVWSTFCVFKVSTLSHTHWLTWLVKFVTWFASSGLVIARRVAQWFSG